MTSQRARRIVLVVDDDPTTREEIVALLSEAGHGVVCAGDGVAALEVARRRKPDVILLDLRMPVMDGWEAYVRMKKLPGLAKVPVIIMSAMPIDNEKKVVINQDAPFWIEKPFSGDEILETVQRHLGRTHQRE
jgi:CheY-like chemotaxis protein